MVFFNKPNQQANSIQSFTRLIPHQQIFHNSMIEPELQLTTKARGYENFSNHLRFSNVISRVYESENDLLRLWEFDPRGINFFGLNLELVKFNFRAFTGLLGNLCVAKNNFSACYYMNWFCISNFWAFQFFIHETKCSSPANPTGVSLPFFKFYTATGITWKS